MNSLIISSCVIWLFSKQFYIKQNGLHFFYFCVEIVREIKSSFIENRSYVAMFPWKQNTMKSMLNQR